MRCSNIISRPRNDDSITRFPRNQNIQKAKIEFFLIKRIAIKTSTHKTAIESRVLGGFKMDSEIVKSYSRLNLDGEGKIICEI